MALDLWAHQFCLVCDKQVHLDGAAYCSESCRLAEFEKTSSPSSPASSPGFGAFTDPWAAAGKRQSTRFYLSPAYDFTNAQPYGSTPSRASSLSNTPSDLSTRQMSRILTPSSSHTSLCSMQSSNAPSEVGQLSDKTRKELAAYAVSFEQVRVQRRRSQ